MISRCLSCAASTLLLAFLALPSHAQTNAICVTQLDDWGDAPEGIPAYPGVIGHFPTCFASSAPGNQTFPPGCTPISSPPGPTGYVHHRTLAGEPHFWLGCYSGPSGLGGIDSEPDGKVNTAPNGTSACLAGLATDCVDGFAGSMYDQDECYGDDNDHGVFGPVGFDTGGGCAAIGAVTFSLASCQPTQGFLNICMDWNGDGDWNDVFVRPCGCVYEWAVKNAPIQIPAGCTTLFSPAFVPAEGSGEGWLRISVTQDPVPDDYPWNGSAGTPGGFFVGGETEDYVATFGTLPTRPQTWGGVKAHYR